MYDYLIVDGYNIIHYAIAQGILRSESMEGARRWLLDRLVNYTYHQGIRTILYFDAQNSSNPDGYVEDFGRLRMIFPPASQSADSAIERVCEELRKNYKIQVATSDGALQQVVFGQGVYRLSARELVEKLSESQKEIKEEIDKKKRNRLDEGLDETVREKLEEWRRK